ncbi:MAG: tRNA (adenosine(37)-N6)-threonylcarbamoyltransferase complex transferase subunit TsaD [Parvibaculum sp.]
MTVMGIETSCDETAVAIVRRDENGNATILANTVLTQIDEHAPYGGVVPEIAARAHLSLLDGLVTRALTTANLRYDELDGIAATSGPGLIGGVIVGLMTAKAIAYAHKLPFIGVNHLEGHALTTRLTNATAFPYLLLLVSGGHCQLLQVKALGDYVRLGTTIDDAVGEAFDKVAKMLGLPYPGGPSVERLAKEGDSTRFDLPRPLANRDDCDFSFSGLKTAVRKHLLSLDEKGAISDQDKADICASFQQAIADVLTKKVGRAMDLTKPALGPSPRLVVAGGVAANQALRATLSDLCAQAGFTLEVPPVQLCTDNGAMIAWAGLEHLATGETSDFDLAPRARWPLDTGSSAR